MDLPIPLEMYCFDFTQLVDENGQRLGSDRTLESMGVHWMIFEGRNSENVVVCFSKETTHTKLFHWRSGSNIGEHPTLVQPGGMLDANYAWGKHLKIETMDHKDYRKRYLAIFYQDNIIWQTSLYHERHCLSPDGRYLCCVLNWEDGDQR
jgi:hypothetical protein